MSCVHSDLLDGDILYLMHRSCRHVHRIHIVGAAEVFFLREVEKKKMMDFYAAEAREEEKKERSLKTKWIKILETEMNEEKKEEEKKHNACESERRGTVSRVDTVYQLMGERNRERFKRLNAGTTRKHFHKYLGVMNLVKAAVPQGKT